MIKIFDYIFWHCYCFCERRKRFFHYDNPWQAVMYILFSILVVLGLFLALISIFITPLTLPNVGSIDARIGSLIIMLPLILYLDYRYCKKKAIIHNNYQVLRERWPEVSNNPKKNNRFILLFTLFTIIIPIIVAIILGELNRRGLLEGYRLFS